MDKQKTVGVDVLAIITVGHADTHNIANQLIGDLQREINETRDAIQEVMRRMDVLMESDYAPTTKAMWRAVSPLLRHETDHRYQVDGEAE